MGLTTLGTTAAMLSLMLATPGFAKDDGPAMPQYILNAHTVAVVIDPQAGVSARDPNANQTARRDVEAALRTWGRFEPILSAEQADIVILLRRSTKAPADVTIADPRQNRRGGVMDGTDDGIAIGAQRGQQPQPSAAGRPTVPLSGGAGGTTPSTQTGTPGDVFEVYEGRTESPLDAFPGWRWVKKDALHPHDVPAVAEFRKAIDEAEKQARQRAGHP